MTLTPQEIEDELLRTRRFLRDLLAMLELDPWPHHVVDLIEKFLRVER